MNIDYAIVSTDGNQLYDGFWDLVKGCWNKIIGVKPILVTIGDEDSFEETKEHVLVSYKKVDGINTGLQSQIARLYVSSLFGEKTCLISDLDMIPLSKTYFVDNAKGVSNDSLLIYTSDAYGYQDQKRYPMCYNLATSKTFKEIMNIDSTFQDFAIKLNTLGLGWDTDEIFFGSCVFEWEQSNREKIVKLQRGFGTGYATKRIDRGNWGSHDFNLVLEEYYYDCHSLRPYNQYKQQINNLIYLMEQKNECKII